MRGIVYRHGAILLIVRECGGFKPSADDIVEVVQDREQVDSEREKVEVRDQEKGDTTRTNNTLKHVTAWMACGWSDCATETL